VPHLIAMNRTLLVLLLIVAWGCSRDSAAADKSGAKTRTTTTARKTGESGGTIDLGADAYKPGTLGTAGGVKGTITLDSSAVLDSMPVTSDQKICGTSSHQSVEIGAKRQLAGALVWVAGVATGKPLPMEKRIEVSSEDCAIEPRVQATVEGAAVNVFNDDKIIHRLVFLRAGTNDTLVVTPFFNIGQVVATEKLAKDPGVVEVRCVQHPWTRGYLAVFDHPYFAVTQKDGRFAIDSLPSGSYRLMIWHEGMAKPKEQPLTITAGGDVTVEVTVSSRTPRH
jgi:hypothetical protein